MTENALEAALRLATTDPAARPAFYRALLESDLLVIGSAPVGPDGKLIPGTRAAFEQWQRNDGVSVLPVFSSREALQRALDKESSFLAMNARALFEMTLGTPLVLNPRNDYGKEFTPNEIASMLATGMPQAPETHTVDTPRQVLLGQPSKIPPNLLDAVSRYCKSVPEVKSAALGLIHDAARGESPNLMLGIQLDEGVDDAREQAVMREIGNVAADAAGGAVVDLVRIGKPGDSLSDFFNSVKPFYRRSLWNALMRPFG